MLCIKVAYYDESHVVRHIPGVVEINQLAQARILQMLGLAYHVAFVRMTLIHFRHQVVAYLRTHTVLIHIVFLKHVLKFGLEGAEHGIDKAVGENGQHS